MDDPSSFPSRFQKSPANALYMERSDRQHQLIADTQSPFTEYEAWV